MIVLATANLKMTRATLEASRYNTMYNYLVYMQFSNFWLYIILLSGTCYQTTWWKQPSDKWGNNWCIWNKMTNRRYSKPWIMVLLQTKTAQIPVTEEVNITLTVNCTDLPGSYEDELCTIVNTTNQSMWWNQSITESSSSFTCITHSNNMLWRVLTLLWNWFQTFHFSLVWLWSTKRRWDEYSWTSGLFCRNGNCSQ